MIPRPALGENVPCRTCHGTGRGRNSDWGDAQAARVRARLRRHGLPVDPPSYTVDCPECSGAGFVPAVVADTNDPGRPARRAVVASGDAGADVPSRTPQAEGQEDMGL